MNSTTKTYALITGASKGLGKSFTQELAKNHHNVLLVASANEGLEQLSRTIQYKYGVKADFFETDLTDLNEIDKLVSWVKNNYAIDVLINNVGLGGSCEFEKSSLDFLDKIIKLNMRALSILTHQFLPLLKKHEHSYILNVSSMASFSPVGYKSIYPASKQFVQSFSLGLGEELKHTGVSISVVHPGSMNTNKFVKDRIAKHGFLVKAGVVSTDTVAATAIKGMFNHKKIIIVGWANYLMRFLMYLVPGIIRLPLMTNAVKKEVQMTIIKNEAS